MSIKQNTYHIIPKIGNFQLFPGLCLKSFREEEFFEDDAFWNINEMETTRILEYLNQRFEEEVSWSTEMKIYGKLDHDCIKIILDTNKIVSMSFRIDFTSNFDLFLQHILNFCDSFQLLIVDFDLNILELDFFQVKENITNSQNFKNYRKLSDL